ncbi:PTS glucitol/sorbitol transporter subunit IIA [Cryobacterium mannosilyticum]|uniref:PTS sorbitol transporter subunit IIA n=1 Tax=Cryobacterium mannosilyticum TaxID=1259190 RepID=A0A4R8W666_9MICO|nr:PTS glucitol/sorbitol transporter subunit IIA [Cryobacterium mannosilyticum]TFC02509.1 PTS sorbitol transporter subunit IIA [Cryobacterium mannosilyticum]
MPVIYRTEVGDIGDQVDSFLDEGMFILFGQGAPDTLKDYCYIVDINASTAAIEPGQQLNLDEQLFTITAVGDVARKNLDGLGHITVVFNGATEAHMHGSVYVEAGTPPKLRVGSVITIQTP